jgi:hypothetical protein
MEKTSGGNTDTVETATEEMEEKTEYQNQYNTHQIDGETILYCLKQKVKRKQNQE